MALLPGTRLGPYEIGEPLGAGGMGEVYRARDTRLDRTVAIKILPETLARDPQFRERFERESRTVAALNHPHICTLHDVGRQDGTDFLVMEYLDGQTLEQRLKNGALPHGEALQIAIQVADALATAHRAGIVHRDLKPGNIMLIGPAGRRGGPSGPPVAKLLDFGLAKVSAPAVVGNISVAPTTPPNLTVQGTILGTFQYMAPEQLEGQEADARTDIFAFGVVLYEMLTGKKAFEGRTQASLIAAILEREPSLASCLPTAPRLLEQFVARCLAKDPEKRWQSALDAKAQLGWIADERLAPQAPAKRARSFRLAVATLGALLVIGAALGAARYLRPAEDPREVEFIVTPQGIGPLDIANLAVSPDGQWIAFTSSSSTRTAIVVRPTASTTLEELEGTDGATSLFWSPDSRYIGFFADGRLKKVAVSGGPPQDIAASTGNRQGATWNNADVILFARENVLYRVSAAGGEPQPLDVDGTPTGTVGLYPRFLSDGRRFLFLSGPGADRGIYAASLDGGGVTSVLKVASRLWLASGHLLYQRDGTLFAHPFDEDTATVTGEPVRIADRIAYQAATGTASFSASMNGVLAYRSGGTAADFQFEWFDRAGTRLGLLGKPAPYRYSFDLSPDGSRVVVSLNGDLWLLESERDVMMRLTTHPGDDSDVIWAPDGTRVAFTSDRNGHQDLFEKKIGSVEEETLLLASPEGKWAEDWSADGRYIAHVAPGRIDVLPLFGDRKPFPVVRTNANEPHVSPDGKWLAYDSVESGTWQVYVVSFPAGDRQRQISTNGGGQSRWRRDGKELFYLASDGKMMAVDVSASDTFDSGPPRVLFDTGLRLDPSHDQYAVTSDGQRFLLMLPVAESAPVTVVVNWTNALKQP